MIEIETIVVGGGPAGAACAGRLKQAGVEALVLDKAAFPRQKTCAGWIPPEVFDLVDCHPEDYPHGLTHFTSFKVSIKSVRLQLKVDQYAVRRIEFDEWLHKRGGVQVEQHDVRTIRQIEGGYEIDDKYHCKWLVGAGGTLCPVQRALFQPKFPRQVDALITAMEAEFLYPYTDPRCHLWFFENKLPGYAWYVPKAGGYINIGVGGKQKKLYAQQTTIIEHWQKIAERLLASGLVKKISSRPKGYTYYLRHKGTRIRSGNAFIIGDAAGMATLDMGEGIRTAIGSGIMAAEAILGKTEYTIDDLPKYSMFSMLKNR